MTFLFMIALRNKTVAHNFLPSFENANDRLCQERVRSRKFATMVTWRRNSLLYWKKQMNILTAKYAAMRG